MLQATLDAMASSSGISLGMASLVKTEGDVNGVMNIPLLKTVNQIRYDLQCKIVIKDA